MPLTSKLRVAVGATQNNVLDLGSVSASLAKDYTVSLADGSGAGQADRVFHDTRTLAASTGEDIDLAGVLTDALGGPFTLARVKGLVIAAAAANTNPLVVGNGGVNAFVAPFGAAAHTVTVRPGAVLALFAGAADANGYVVGAGTGDLLRITNGGAGTPVTYDIIIIGASI